MAQSPKRRANLLGARIRAWFEGRTSGTGSDAAPGPGEDLERELRRTQAQLVEARAEITALRRQKGDLRPALARVLKKTDEELLAYRYCAVQPAEDTCEWEAVTERCCLGGCDMGVYTFSAEREALLFSALLEAIGYRPDHNTACSSLLCRVQEGSHRNNLNKGDMSYVVPEKGDTVLAGSKMFTVGGEVFANHTCDYGGLFGTVTEIRTGPDQ
ncbi:MAG: hypothetical protein ACLU9S_15685 [Oscillospiraceae bacterium]